MQKRKEKKRKEKRQDGGVTLKELLGPGNVFEIETRECLLAGKNHRLKIKYENQ